MFDVIKSPISDVVHNVFPSDIISPVLYPFERTFLTAFSTASDSLERPKVYFSIIAAESGSLTLVN